VRLNAGASEAVVSGPVNVHSVRAANSNDYPDRLRAFTAAPSKAFRVLRYGREPDQFGELWRTKGFTPQPVAVLIHGGYWRARYGLDLMHKMAADLCTRGYAVWNLEYRRIGSHGGGWPGTFADIASGIDLLPSLANRHRIDPNRVTVIGHSAGGHLALWAAARRRLPSGWGRPQVIPVHAVALAGVCDLVQGARERLSNDAVAELLGGGPSDKPDIYRQACPKQLLPLGVRQTLVHGDADDAVPFSLSESYADAARQAGDKCAFLPLPGADHFDVIDPASPAWTTITDRALRPA
jgi:acetyl esterase/lipase